jgi:hypothetical protein
MKNGSGGIVDLELNHGMGQPSVYIIDQKPAACQPEFFGD